MLAAVICVVLVGLAGAGRVHDLDDYWTLLEAGRSVVGPVPEDRWLGPEHHDPDVEAPGKINCIEAGWPGERMAWSSAQARLWTSIRTLRAMGLGPILETVGEGYRLAADVRVRVA